MSRPTPRCGDHDHSWSTPGRFVVVYCTRCGLTLKASFAATAREIAQLPQVPASYGLDGERYDEAA